MVVPGGTVVVSVGRTIVLGGRDSGRQGSVVGRVVSEMMKCSTICTVEYYYGVHDNSPSSWVDSYHCDIVVGLTFIPKC